MATKDGPNNIESFCQEDSMLLGSAVDKTQLYLLGSPGQQNPSLTGPTADRTLALLVTLGCRTHH